MWLVLCLLFCCMGAAACSDTDTENQKAGQDGTGTTTWNSGDSLVTGDNKQLTEPPAAWKISEETKLKSEKIEYDPKTDGNWRMASEWCCETEDGNLYQIEADSLGNGKYLYCYDAKSHGYRKVCNRPECYHTNEDCDAFLAEEAFGMEYYNGKLYTIPIERDDRDWQEIEGKSVFSSTTYANLYAIDPNGTGRVKVQSLKVIERKNADCNITGININFTIHKGYVYYRHNLGEATEMEDYYKNGKNCIFRVPLGGSEAEAECIYVMPKLQHINGLHEIFNQEDTFIRPYGNYIYFLEEKINPENQEGALIYALNRIDIINKQVEKIQLEKPLELEFYVTEEGIYYYSSKLDGKLRLHHLEDGTEEIIVNQTDLSKYRPLGFNYDGMCWYAFFDKGQEEFVTDIVVLDSDYKKIGELDFGVHLYMFLDAKYNLALFTEDNKLYGWLDKADIAKGDLTVHRAEQTE